MNDITYPVQLRSFRVRVAMLLRVLAMGPAEFACFALNMRGVKLRVPPEVEAARIEGWCRLTPGGYGAAAPAMELPLNLRDDAGNAVGEAVIAENRRGDLWALVLWRREGEDLETFASRVRMARVLGTVPVLLSGGVGEATAQGAAEAVVPEPGADESYRFHHADGRVFELDRDEVRGREPIVGDWLGFDEDQVLVTARRSARDFDVVDHPHGEEILAALLDGTGSMDDRFRAADRIARGEAPAP